MKILGISGSLISDTTHDTAAALLVDGRLVCNYEEERLSRVKHATDTSMPRLAIKRIFEEQNISFEDIDAIGIPYDIGNQKVYINRLIKYFGIDAKCFHNLYYPGHHVAHIYDSFFQSGFKSAACLVIDGYGDQKESTTLAHFISTDLKILKTYPVSLSLGTLYENATLSCGFSEFAEGKLMGLSSYGKAVEEMPLEWKEDELQLKAGMFNNENITEIDLQQLRYFETILYPYNAKSNKKYPMYFINLAASVQEFYNVSIMNFIKKLKEQTNEDNLILSGGCIQNCIGNNLVVESGLFKNVFAAPAPHDAGCAAGLAFYAAQQVNEKIQNNKILVSYTGKQYSDKEILVNINKEEFKISEYSKNKAARLLKENKILAWFQGGSEIGPRALGHRSIIANPSTRENLFIVNETIKNREAWRPLAPTILKEKFFEIFEASSYDLTEFMLRTIQIKKAWRKKLAAVCHIDNTSRPQTITEEQNKEFYDLLVEYNNITKVPCLLNTSFNGKDEPIIETPSEAINFLRKTPNLFGIVFNAKYFIERI